MRVRISRESAPGEHRVALVPEVVARLQAAGFEISVERGAGVAAGFLDADFEGAGAIVVDAGDDGPAADLIVRVAPPSAAEIVAIPRGAVVIGFLAPLSDPDGIARLRAQDVTAFAMESIPRTTRAQSMDALSSQATVAGYKAVLIAADRTSKMFPLLMTAAGTIAPARALILGAGVAGLQAIATARRLGAVVSAFDVRPAVKEQVESLGAAFLELGVRSEETSGGYATELTPEQQAQQQAELEQHIANMDIVVTTALVPGRPAPTLIPGSAVSAMRKGSVIVDLAAEAGGNCELTVPGEEVVRDGVTIVGLTNLPAMLASDASRLYARNVSALVQHLAPDGVLALDFDDEITAGACVASPGGGA
jgi:H+-translocating NAD(P) transhydrogenase subunit alpha